MNRKRLCTRLWCQKCGCNVDFVDLLGANVFPGIALPTFRDCAEANNWHYFEGPDGKPLVCLGSLLKSI